MGAQGFLSLAKTGLKAAGKSSLAGAGLAVAGGVFKGIGAAIEAQRLREEERAGVRAEGLAEERQLAITGRQAARQQGQSAIQILQQQRAGAFEKFRFSKARDTILGAF